MTPYLEANLIPKRLRKHFTRKSTLAEDKRLLVPCQNQLTSNNTCTKSRWKTACSPSTLPACLPAWHECSVHQKTHNATYLSMKLAMVPEIHW